MAQTPESRLANLGIHLPVPPAPVASYVPWVRTGQLIVVSGQLPILDGKLIMTGKVGGEIHEEQGAEAARQAAINAIAQLKAAVNELSKVRRIVRLEGYVASAPGFHHQPKVVNGASDLMVAVFGERGQHSRVSIGAFELPLGAPVEIALWAEVE